MALRNDDQRFGTIAKTFHWGMAAIVIPLWILGFVMVQPTQDLLRQYEWYQIHKSFGFVVFGLALLRAFWRLIDPAPPLPIGMPAGQRAAAQIVHALLYVLLTALPVTGFLMSAASPLGIPTVLFETIPIPHPIAPSERTYAVFQGLHYYLGLTLAALLVLHVLGAVHHTIVAKDRIWRRMVPFVR